MRFSTHGAAYLAGGLIAWVGASNLKYVFSVLAIGLFWLGWMGMQVALTRLLSSLNRLFSDTDDVGS